MLVRRRQIRYGLYCLPTDMRKGFDSLSGLVRSTLDRDPLSGEVFVFVSRTRMHVTLLYWDGDGFVLYYKRLEKGCFRVPRGTTATLPSWRIPISSGLWNDSKLMHYTRSHTRSLNVSSCGWRLKNGHCP